MADAKADDGGQRVVGGGSRGDKLVHATFTNKLRVMRSQIRWSNFTNFAPKSQYTASTNYSQPKDEIHSCIDRNRIL